MFLISKYVGIFPFSVVKNNFVKSKLYFPILVTLITLAILRLRYSREFSGSYFTAANILRFKDLFIFSRQSLSLMPIVSIIWMQYNTKQLTQVFKTVIAVQRLTNYSDTSSEWIWGVVVLVHSIINLMPFVYRCEITMDFICEYPFLEGIVGLLNNLDMLLVILQFVFLVNQLRYQFTSLSLTLSKENSVDWIKWQRALGANCHNLSRCYSPQLLLFVGDAFIKAITDIYVCIMSTSFGIELMHLVFSILTNLTSISLLWYVIYVCSETVNEVSVMDLVYIYFCLSLLIF